MPDRIRILIVDDHSLFRTSLATALAAEPDFVMAGDVGTVHEALRMLQHSAVDLLLLDMNLGVEQGGSLLKSFPLAGSGCKVLVVTAGVSEREAAWLLRRGCAGIFLKTEPLTKLFEWIRAIARGEQVMTAPLADREGVRPRLTVRESAVLRYVCEGLTNKEIAGNMGISEANVKSYLQQLFAKMGARSRAQLVSLAIEDYWDQLDTTR